MTTFLPATIAVLLGAVYHRGQVAEAIEDKDYGITSIIAALCVFALGMRPW